MVVKDSAGRKIGEIKQQGSRQKAYDAQGRLLGTYDSKTDVTLDVHGKRFGTGNLLATLVM
jgi:YD repeat-containing protein